MRGKNQEVIRSEKFFLLLAETFKALGDVSRLQVVWLLSKGEKSVGALSDELHMSQPAISHHLRTLRNLRLVKIRKDGTTNFYSLDDEHIEKLLIEGTDHVEDILK